MRTTTNYLILNQACADIAITITQLINALHNNYFGGNWFGGLFGQITCKLHLASISIPQYVSIWILVTIAIDRFYAVTRPFQQSPISRHLKKTVMLIWIWGLSCSITVLVNGGLKEVKQSFHCSLESIFNGWKAYDTVDVSLNIFLPSLIIVVLYTIVCFKLWSRQVPGEGANQDERQVEAVQTAKKVTRMMIVVVILFVLCWFPFFIIVTFQTLLTGSVQISLRLLLYVGLLTISYSGLNPYIYFTFSHKFRFLCKKLIGNFITKTRISNLHTSRSQSIELQQM